MKEVYTLFGVTVGEGGDFWGSLEGLKFPGVLVSSSRYFHDRKFSSNNGEISWPSGTGNIGK